MLLIPKLLSFAITTSVNSISGCFTIFLDLFLLLGYFYEERRNILTGNEIFDAIRKVREELLQIFDPREPRDRVRCLALFAARFGDKLWEEMPQPVKKVARSQVS